MIKKQNQIARDNVSQNQISAQNNFNITINSDFIPSDFIKLLNSILSTFVTKKEFESFQNKINELLAKIDINNKTTPSINIWGATVDSLKWNLNEQQKHIRDMFINILISDADKTKKNKIQPSFIDAVKHLSINDAIFLASIRSKVHNIFEGFFEIPSEPKHYGEPWPQQVRFRVIGIDNEWYEIDDIIIDNLERLKIISINKNYNPEREESEKLGNDIKPTLKFDSSGVLKHYDKNEYICVKNIFTLKFTAYGKALLETIFE